MINDTLEMVAIVETDEAPEILTTVTVDAKSDEDLACAKCVGECKIF